MARKGAFDGVDAALMIHPAGVNLVTMPCIAIGEVETRNTAARPRLRDAVGRHQHASTRW